MNLFDMNNDNITMNIDGKDIEMKPAICFGKVYDKWLVSRCGKVWSPHYNRIIRGSKFYEYKKNNVKKLKGIMHQMQVEEEDFWGDGSGLERDGYDDRWRRIIKQHKIVMDTWAPLYDNPPKGISWEFWEIGRKYPDNLKFYSESIVIDHIDDNPANNHLDNLRRVTTWDNQASRKSRGI